MAALLLSILMAPVAAAQVEGAAVYQANCAGCHQPGGAGLPPFFPPLAGNPNVQDAEYVRTVLVNGKQGEITVLGQTYNGVMPAQALEEAEIVAVIAFIQNDLGSGTATSTTTTSPSGPGTTMGDQAFLDAAARGEQLFVGSMTLGNGGTACYACHTAGEFGNLSGSGLGPDLTDAFQRLGGGEGLRSALVEVHGDVMSGVYAEEPLTEIETVELAAFLEVTSGGSAPDTGVDWLLVLALAGLTALIAWVALIRSGRNAEEEAG
jgi:mono/diheme cytochrome c family protein